MPQEEAMSILLQSLGAMNRTLTKDQQEIVRKAIPSESNVSALHVRLLTDIVSKWESSEGMIELPGSVHDLVRSVLLNVQEECNGPFVELIMRLMLVSRDGASQQNLADIVSTRDDILGKKYNEPPIRYVPPFVFANWRKLIQDFVVERGVNNVVVLNFFHRQFFEVAEKLYLKTERDREDALLLLYRYFSGILAKDFQERNISPQPLFFKPLDGNKTGLPNLQRLRESVNALIGLGDSLSAAADVCSLEYITAKFSVGASFGSDLLNEILEVQRMLENDLAVAKGSDIEVQLNAAKKQIKDFYLFVFCNYQALVGDPSLALCIALNFPKEHAMHIAAEKYRKEFNGQAGTPILHIIGQHNPSASNSAQGTIAFDSTETREVIDRTRLMDVNSPPDSSIFAITQRGSIMVYDRRTLRERFAKPSGLRATFWTAAAVSSNAEYFAAATSDGLLRVCLAADGVDLASFRHAHVGWVTCIDWSPTDLRLATAGSDNMARVWRFDPARRTLERIAMLYGHLARVTSIRFSPTGGRLATSSLDGRVLIFSSKTYELLQAFETDVPTGGTCVQWCPALAGSDDGRPPVGEELVVSFDRQRVVFWPVSGETHTHDRVDGHMDPRLVIEDAGFAEITHCAVSPDGREILAVGGDRCGRVFDRVTGKLVSILLDHSKPISKCDWDEDTILTLSHDGSLKIWNYSDLTKIEGVDRAAVDKPPVKILSLVWDLDPAAFQLLVLDRGHNMNTYSVNNDSRSLVEVSSKTVASPTDGFGGIYPSWDGEEVGILPAENRAEALCFFADNTRLACVGMTHTTVWDVDGLMRGTGAAPPEAPLAQLDLPGFACDVSTDGRRAVVLRAGGDDWNYYDVVGAWALDLVDGKVLFEIVDGFGGHAELEDQARRSVKMCKITR
ncbi:hypothetical protein HK405_008182, partial [Cladochytrium tenue]